MPVVVKKSLMRILLVATVCLSTLMLMLSFKVATNSTFSKLVERQFALQGLEENDHHHHHDDRNGSSTVTSSTIITVAQSQSKSGSRVFAKKGSINALDYPFVIEEPDICTHQRPDLFVLVYVHTAPDHFKHRAVIRQTWGDSKLYSRLKAVTVFFVGRTSNGLVENALRLESERYGDIIQADFMDTYKNLSLKAVVALRWVTEYCSLPLYVLKVDDDMFVNMFNLVRHLHYLQKYEADVKHISCLVWSSMSVLRSPDSKWYVSKEEFFEDKYPSYCSGSAFFMPTSVTFLLYNASLSAPFLWVDDVYATGILAKTADVKHSSISSIVSLSSSKYSQLIEGEAVFGHMTGDKGVDLRYQYWKKVIKKEEWAVS